MADVSDEEHDHKVKIHNLGVEIDDLLKGIEILYSLINDGGDESHIKWISHKIYCDAENLCDEFSKGFGQKTIHQPVAA